MEWHTWKEADKHAVGGQMRSGYSLSGHSIVSINLKGTGILHENLTNNWKALLTVLAQRLTPLISFGFHWQRSNVRRVRSSHRIILQSKIKDNVKAVTLAAKLNAVSLN